MTKDLTTIFSQPQRWRCYYSERTRPHAVYKAANGDGPETAVLLVRRSRSYGDYALNKAALDYVTNGLRAEHITEAHVVLVNGWEPIIIAHATAVEVAERCAHVTPIRGQWGEFYWLNDQLRPVTDVRDQDPW
jgi:hypothetical protein